MLLDTAHNLLDSMVESSDQHNREPNDARASINTSNIESSTLIIEELD